MHIHASIAEQLESRAYAIVDDTFPLEVLEELRSEALDQYSSGAFKAARIGKGIGKQRIDEVRGDQVKWLNRDTPSTSQSVYWFFLDELRAHLTSFFRIHLERSEIHYAVYPEGAFYAPHFDQFREQADRIFSIILYLNLHWKKGDGGELRIHHEEQHIDVEPAFGRIVCFRSDEILHEVLTANKMRISLTGWIRRDKFIF